MLDDDLDLTDGGQDESEAKPVQQQAAPVTMPAAEIARVSTTIVQEVMRSLSQNAAQDMRGRQSATETWVADMIRDGADPRAVKAMLKLQEATKQDDRQQQQAVRPAAQIDDYNNAVWEKTEEIFDELADHVPGKFAAAKQNLMEKVQKEIMNNPDFDEEKQRVLRFQKPTSKALKLACALVMDKQLKAEGRTHVQLPVDRSTAKPAPPVASNPIDSLTPAQREYYTSFKAAYQKNDKDGKNWQKELLRDAKSL